jgi:hypothetical protein
MQVWGAKRGNKTCCASPTVATGANRRGHGEDTICSAAAKNPYVGAVSLGFGPDGRRIRRKVYGRTKQEVRDKLKALHAEG